MSNVWDPASNEILVRASEIASPEQRAAYLDEVCAGNPDQRERVEQLLRALQKGGSFLDGPPDLTRDQGESDDDSAHCIGTQIGPYEVLQQIGEGGFGVVYMAEQRRPVRRKVALKIIKPGMDSREVMARFEAEQQALALMDHVNIARVLDAGTTDNDRPYFAMELVKGVPITEYCDKNKLSLPERLELFVTVSRAVQHAHQKGVIHRDIKPSNIMVTLHDGKPVPKVIDFGVAKAISQSLSERTLFTHYGQMIGTPQYMSPEQAEMSGLEVDTRSDIYSLGVLLYEMLTATTPVTAEQLRATGIAEIQRVIREEEPATPSSQISTLGDRLTIVASHRQCDASKLGHLLRGELDWIVMKSLDKDRTRRYETASAFAGDVEAYLHDEPVLARPPSVGYLLGKAIRKHRVLFATSAAIAVILVAATAISSLLAVRARFAENQADLHLAIANDNATKADRLAAEAVEKNELLLAAKLKLNEQLYAANMNAVSQAYDDGDIARMDELLQSHRPHGTEIDQRGIEWYLWWRIGRLQQARHRPPWRGALMRQDVNPKGDVVAVVGTPNVLYLYSSFEQQLIRSPIRIGSHFDWPCFSPNGGSLVVLGIRDGIIRVFDTKNWQLVQELQSPGVRSVAISKGASPMMATGSSNKITLWSRTQSDWSVVEELPMHGDVKNLEFTPQGRYLLAQVDNDRIVRYDVQHSKIVGTLKLEGIVQAISTSPNGDILAVGQKDGGVQIWALDAIANDVRTQPLRSLSADESVIVLAFSATGKRLAAGTGGKNTVVVWDMVRNDREVSKHDQPIATIHAHSQIVMGVGFVKDKDENAIWSSSVDGYLKSWDLSDCQPHDTLTGIHASSPLGFDSKNVLLYLDSVGTIQRWNATDREHLAPIDEAARYGRAHVSDDGSVLAGVTNDNELRVWRTDLREMLNAMPLGHRTVRGLAVSHDGKRVVCVVRDAGVDRVVAIDMERGEVMGPLDYEAYFSDYLDGYVNSTPVLSPNARYCAIQIGLDASFSTNLFNITERPFVRKYQTKEFGPELSAVFTRDGKTLAVGSTKNTIRLLDADNGSRKQTLKGSSSKPMCLAFTRDGSRLFSGGKDGVHIWRVSDGSLLSSLRSGAELKSIAVAPDEEFIAALTVDGTINVWRTASKADVDE